MFDFIFSDALEHFQAVRGENFGGTDAAEVAPVVAVRCQYEDGVIVKVLPGNESGSVGENDVVFCETFFRSR